jgi:ABC-2 type transport system permease protein
MKYIKMYIACTHTAFSRAAAYRADFLLGSIITLLSNILFPLVTVLIYTNGATFPGWSMWEVLLIQSVYSMSTGAAAMFFYSVVWVTMEHIREGSFETVLLKPVSPLFFIASSNFDPQYSGLFLGGLVLTIVSSAHTNISGLSGILQFILLFTAGLAVMSGLYLVMAAITFKWVGNARIPEIFDSITTFGKYPVGIFPRGIQVLSTLIVPVSVIGYFPASALLGRLEPMAYISLIPCLLFLAFGIWIYNRMIKLYEGVGG